MGAVAYLESSSGTSCIIAGLSADIDAAVLWYRSDGSLHTTLRPVFGGLILLGRVSTALVMLLAEGR